MFTFNYSALSAEGYFIIDDKKAGCIQVKAGEESHEILSRETIKAVYSDIEVNTKLTALQAETEFCNFITMLQNHHIWNIATKGISNEK